MLSTSTGGTSPVQGLPQTPGTIAWEAEIRKLPYFIQLTGEQREQFLITLTARAILIGNFEQAEGQIWGSQVRILEHLNRNPAGVPLSTLKDMFYEPAKKQFPEAFGPYTFENYMRFLESQRLISVVGGNANLTDQGREYLVWRVEQRKADKVGL